MILSIKLLGKSSLISCMTNFLSMKHVSKVFNESLCQFKILLESLFNQLYYLVSQNKDKLVAVDNWVAKFIFYSSLSISLNVLQQ